MVGSISCRMADHMCLGSVRQRYVETKMDITTSSNEVINANKAPEITPGFIIGSVTRKKVFNRLAPKLIAACSREWSKP